VIEEPDEYSAVEKPSDLRWMLVVAALALTVAVGIALVFWGGR
jgi:hypothetical protein